MKTEYWDVLNSNGELTGEKVKRGFSGRLKNGQYHLVVHIWVKNSKGQLLIQKRSPHKHPMAGEWAATGGAVISGETSKKAAIRELKEELGIIVHEDEIYYLGRIKRKANIKDIWWAGVDADTDRLDLQEEEVIDAKWVTKDELHQMINKGQFHNYGEDYFKKVFAI